MLQLLFTIRVVDHLNTSESQNLVKRDYVILNIYHLLGDMLPMHVINTNQFLGDMLQHSFGLY